MDKYVRRGAVVPARQAAADAADETLSSGLVLRAGWWVVEHGADVQETMSADAFAQTYQPLADHLPAPTPPAP